MDGLSSVTGGYIWLEEGAISAYTVGGDGRDEQRDYRGPAS